MTTSKAENMSLSHDHIKSRKYELLNTVLQKTRLGSVVIITLSLFLPLSLLRGFIARNGLQQLSGACGYVAGSTGILQYLFDCVELTC